MVEEELTLLDHATDELVDLEEGESEGFRDTNRRPYSGDKCTYNMRRMDYSGTASDWSRYQSSSSRFVDPTFAHDSNMYYW